MQRNALILMETEASWPAWLDAAYEDVETLWQSHDQIRIDFFDAALERIRASSDASRDVVLVCAPTDAAANSMARAAFLSGLASALELHGGCAEMVLVADGDYGTRAALASIVLQLSADLEQAGSGTRVRLRAQPRSTRPPPALPG